MASSAERWRSGGLVLLSLLGALRRTALQPLRAVAGYAAGAAVLAMALATPAWARFPTAFSEAASAAPIIIRGRVESVATREDGGAQMQVKVIRTFIRSFAARHFAHSELLPGQVITLPGHPDHYRKGREYLLLLSESGARFEVRNHCGTDSSLEVVLGTVPDFDCADRMLWTLPEVEGRLTQRSVCPERRYSTFSEPGNSLLGRPEVLTTESFDPHAFHPFMLLGVLWTGVALVAASVLIARQRRRVLASIPASPAA